MADDWEPPGPEREWATAQGFAPETVRYETDKFRDHYIANGERRPDWAASWRNWMRRSEEYAGRGRPGPNGRSPTNGRPSAAQRIDANNDEFRRLVAGGSADAGPVIEARGTVR